MTTTQQFPRLVAVSALPFLLALMVAVLMSSHQSGALHAAMLTPLPEAHSQVWMSTHNDRSQTGALPQQPVAQTYSVDGLVVFERGIITPDIYYAFYGHNPQIPTPLTQTLTWNWWTIGAGATSDTISKTRPITTTANESDFRPDVAFSREGFALAVWGAVESAGAFTCPGPVSVPRYRGSIRSAQLLTQNNGDVQWQERAPIDPPANSSNEDHIYSNPSVAVDSDGSALVVWVYTRITHSCPRQAQMQVLSRRWYGTSWVDQQIIAPNPTNPAQFEATPCAPPGVSPPLNEFCEHFTDIAFTARLATDATPATRQQAIMVWYDFIATTSATCFGSPVPVNLFWPRYGVWNGGQGTIKWALAEIPGRPPTSTTFMRSAGLKLGISADQYQNARVVFPVQRDDDPCSSPGEANQVYFSNWISNTQMFSAAALLANGRSPDVALMQDNTAIGVYGDGGNVKWASAPFTSATWLTQGDLAVGCCENPSTVAALHAAGPAAERAVVVYSELYELRWSERVGEGGWSGTVVLDDGPALMPELAAHSGSPSLPHAEWGYLGYFAADNDLHPFIARDDRSEMRQVGSSALLNAVVLVDPLNTWDVTAWGAFNVGGAPPPNPFTNGNVRYQYLKRNSETELRDLGEQNSGHSDTLRDFLAWSMEKYPARRYTLDLADHGEGWKRVCQDWRQGNDWLTLPELRNALTAIQGGSTFRWNQIVFSACLMGQVEVAYQIRDLARFMVASEELMPGPGPNYVDVMNDFIANPFRPDADRARQMVTAFQNSYTGGANLNSLETLAAIDLAQINALTTNISAFATALNNWLTDPSVAQAVRDQRKQNIQNQRNATEEFPHTLWQGQGYSAEGYRDLDRFAELVINSLLPDDPTTLLDDQVRTTATNVRNARAAAVIQNFADTGHPNARGLSIYLENSGAVFGTQQVAYTATLFGTDIASWRSFIGNQTGSLNTVLSLSSLAPYTLLRIQDNEGKRIGIPVIGSARCSTLCGTEISGGRCIESPSPSGGTIIVTPETTNQFTWFVDGTLLTSPTGFTLTIQLVSDGVVLQTFIQAGSLSAGQVISGTYPPYRNYLPLILRNP